MPRTFIARIQALFIAILRYGEGSSALDPADCQPRTPRVRWSAMIARSRRGAKAMRRFCACVQGVTDAHTCQEPPGFPHAIHMQFAGALGRQGQKRRTPELSPGRCGLSLHPAGASGVSERAEKRSPDIHGPRADLSRASSSPSRPCSEDGAKGVKRERLNVLSQTVH
jgi:hypothetical protein